MTKLLSTLYDVTLKKDIREAAANGFVRPTIGQSFVTHRDFEEILSKYIVAPTLTVEGAPTSVQRTPTLSTSEFNVFGDTDTHINTDWQILDSQNNVVMESLTDATNKVSIKVNSQYLIENTDYKFRVRHRGANIGVSNWASVLAKTAEIFNTIIEFSKENVFNSAPVSIPLTNIVMLSENKVCINFSASGNWAIVGTITDDTITFGAKTAVSSAIITAYMVELDETHVFCVYRFNSNPFTGRCKVGTITGNTIAFGNEYVFSDYTMNWPCITKLSNTKVCLAYADYMGGTMQIATISGNVASFGNRYTFSPKAEAIELVTINQDKVCVAYRDHENSGSYGKLKTFIATISGYTITFGTQHTFYNTLDSMGDPSTISMVLIASNKIFLAYSHYTANVSANSYKGNCLILNIDNNTITSGDTYIFNNAYTYQINAFKLSDVKALVVYTLSTGALYYEVCNINGNIITFDVANVIGNYVPLSGYQKSTMLGNKLYTAITSSINAKVIVSTII